jgi:hypothetical protein
MSSNADHRPLDASDIAAMRRAHIKIGIAAAVVFFLLTSQ